ncbi:MAG: 3-dehydroquinate synthase [Planctomycetota bacterium]
MLLRDETIKKADGVGQMAATGQHTTESSLSPWKEMPTSTLPSLPFQVTRQQAYEVWFAADSGADLGSWIREQALGGRVFVLADTVAWEHHGQEFLDSWTATKEAPIIVPFQGGEEGKSWSQAGRVLDVLADLGFKRRDLLLLFGGGVTCDAGGLIASLFMRGVPYALIPTTVMAQVDAAIGGKVAVNHARAKNLVGAFHQPRGIWIDPRYAQTTSRAERINGFAEMVKVALLEGAPAFARMEAGLPHLLTNHLQHADVVAMIREAIRIKLAEAQIDTDAGLLQITASSGIHTAIAH